MDKQLRVFEVLMHILCSVLGSACVTLMNTISFLRTEGCLSFSTVTGMNRGGFRS